MNPEIQTDDNLLAQCGEYIKKIFPGAGVVLVVAQPDKLPVMLHTYEDDRDAAYMLQSAQQHLGSVPARRYTLGPNAQLVPVSSLPAPADPGAHARPAGVATNDSDFDAD